MNRSARVALSEETLRIIEGGSYLNGCGETVPIAPLVDAAVGGTLLFRDEDFPPERMLSAGFDTRFDVTAETTLSAVARRHAADLRRNRWPAPPRSTPR